MPALPIDHPEPFAAILGTMLYPGPDPDDIAKARGFATQFLAKPLAEFFATGGQLLPVEMQALLVDGGVRLDDLEKRWFEATMAGEMFKVLFALYNTDPALASWNHAITLAEQTASRHGVAGVRSTMMAAQKKYARVLHLWGAWAIREGRFLNDPVAGYDYWLDLQFFLAEAEILRQWGQSWKPDRAKSQPPLSADVWHMPDHWRPPDHQPDWPDSGRVPKITIPEHDLVGLRPAGRPRKTRR